VVNKNINSCPGENRAQKIPYEVFYGKKASQSLLYMLDSDILKHAKTGYSLAADELIEKLVIESLKEVTNRHHSDEGNKKPSGTTKGKKK
jgi:hypothetical protein